MACDSQCSVDLSRCAMDWSVVCYCGISDQAHLFLSVEVVYILYRLVLSCQPRVTVTPWFVYKVIGDLESIDHLCINPIHRIGLIHK